MKKMAVHTGWATFVAATLLFVSCQKMSPALIPTRRVI